MKNGEENMIYSIFKKFNKEWVDFNATIHGESEKEALHNARELLKDYTWNKLNRIVVYPELKLQEYIN